MKKTVLYTLLFSGVNLLLILLLGLIGQGFAGAFYSLWYSVALLAELIVGAFVVANSGTAEMGKGLLLSAAILLLVGLSICTSNW